MTLLQAMAWMAIVLLMMFALVMFSWWLDRRHERFAERRRNAVPRSEGEGSQAVEDPEGWQDGGHEHQ